MIPDIIVEPKKRRPPRLRAKRTPLTVDQILGWADAHFRRKGRWPAKDTGRIAETLGETWCAINLALVRGGRSLPGGTTLAQLLAEQRGVRNIKNLPPLSRELILTWADAHFQRTREWPTSDSGAIPEAPGETWRNLNAALQRGRRGLAVGGTLPRLLAEERGVRNRKGLEPLTVEQILAWADAFFTQCGRWPTADDGGIAGAEGETWSGVDAALMNGCRGQGGGTTLAQLLERHRGVRNRKNLPPLTERQILAWARQYHARTGEWPHENSGLVEDTNGEVWLNVSQALRAGIRGLPGGDSLAKLLSRRLNVRNGADLPALSVEQVLQWADTHFRLAGHWPKAHSGDVPGAQGEKWQAIDDGLHIGLRGLPGGLSLARLLEKHRGVRNKANAPRLTIRQILKWADEHYLRTGEWPVLMSGVIPDTDGETWAAIYAALQVGRRGLPGGDTLYQLLVRNDRITPRMRGSG